MLARLYSYLSCLLGCLIIIISRHGLHVCFSTFSFSAGPEREKVREVVMCDSLTDGLSVFASFPGLVVWDCHTGSQHLRFNSSFSCLSLPLKSQWQMTGAKQNTVSNTRTRSVWLHHPKCIERIELHAALNCILVQLPLATSYLEQEVTQ